MDIQFIHSLLGIFLFLSVEPFHIPLFKVVEEIRPETDV